MSNLFLTLVIAFILIVLALAALAIGWLIAGKSKVQGGTSGKEARKNQDESCGTSCHHCSDQKENEKTITEETLSEKK